MINIYYQTFVIKILILSIRSGDISNFINFDSNAAISFNALCFSYSKSVNNLKILFSLSNKSSNYSFLLFSASSFNLSISFIHFLANILNSLSFLIKSYS